MRAFVLLSVSVLLVGAALANDDIEQGYRNNDQAASADYGAVEKKYVDSEIVPLEVRYGFTLNVCNKTSRDIAIAFYAKMNHIVLTEDYAVQGWYEVKKNSCIDIKNMAKGDFAFYASNFRGREWGGADMRLCIEKNQFKRLHYAELKCEKSLRKGFKRLSIDSEYHTITLE